MTTPTEALRYNEGKPELAELFHFDLRWLAAHTAAGRAKYPDAEPGVPNWTLGGKPDAEYLNSAARHLAALVQGEEYDPELGTHHAAAIAWNMLAMLTCNRSFDKERTDLTWTPVTEIGSAGPGDLIRSTIDPGAVETITSIDYRSTGPYPYVKTVEDPAGWYASEWWEIGR